MVRFDVFAAEAIEFFCEERVGTLIGDALFHEFNEIHNDIRQKNFGIFNTEPSKFTLIDRRLNKQKKACNGTFQS